MRTNIKKEYKAPDIPFKSNPNFAFKEFLIKDNYDDYFQKDSFEVYYSYQNYNEIMVVSPNKDGEIRIMRLKDKKIIKILKGHVSLVYYVKHFFNKKTNIDYLISIDNDKIMNIWDLSNNYNIKQTLELNYSNFFNAILIFDKDKDYIITSTNSIENLAEDYTKIFSFDSGKLIRNIHKTNMNETNYTLDWKNSNDNNYYIIDFCVGKIVINKLSEEKKYAELKSNVEFENHLNYVRGCIFGNNNDKLCSLLELGYIHIWDLTNSILINTFIIRDGKLNNLINWSNQYLLISDKKDNSFYIVDTIHNKIISKFSKYFKDFIISFKKVIHPNFGESLIISDYSHHIQLWTIP